MKNTAKPKGKTIPTRVSDEDLSKIHQIQLFLEGCGEKRTSNSDVVRLGIDVVHKIISRSSNAIKRLGIKKL